MTHTFFEHVSDIGIRSEGRSLEEAIEDGASAMLEVMFDLDTVTEKTSRTIEARATDPETLFVEVLNEILSVQGRDNLALKRLHTIELRETAEGLSYRGEVYGEEFNPRRHEVRTEVKAATYAALRYERDREGRHTLQCILDV